MKAETWGKVLIGIAIILFIYSLMNPTENIQIKNNAQDPLIISEYNCPIEGKYYHDSFCEENINEAKE